jgi:hypothetical protein
MDSTVCDDGRSFSLAASMTVTAHNKLDPTCCLAYAFNYLMLLFFDPVAPNSFRGDISGSFSLRD